MEVMVALVILYFALKAQDCLPRICVMTGPSGLNWLLGHLPSTGAASTR